MFAKKDKHCLIEHMHITERRLLGTLSFVVQNLFRYIPVLIAGFQDTVGKVDILTIHKEIFVEKSNRVKNTSPYHHECSTNHLNLCWLVPRQVTHIIMS